MVKIKDKRCLVTGGAGSIGSELVRQLAVSNPVYILDNNETGAHDLAEEMQQDGHNVHCRVGDIRDPDTVQEVFSDFKPQIVFHAAAYKHVTPMEDAPIEAINTNILGTWNVIKWVKYYQPYVEKFVLISTDKAVNSHSVMGATKRVCEIMTRNQGQGFIVVRFGNVVGSRGSVLPLWENQVKRGKPITITNPDMTRFFMTIPQAVELVIEAAKVGRGGEIMILDMGEPKRIGDLAKELYPDYPQRIVGVRQGESMDEVLMFEEEKKVAIKDGSFFIIR